MSYTIGSLFSGIGGIDLAAHWAGFTTSWFVEREPFCQKVLAKHWPDVPIHNDVFECHDLPYVDVIVGGFPCQPFSVAGKRQGADDERYLLPEMLRIVSEVKPYAVLFENVPGFPQLNDGAEFKYLLKTLAEMGFDAEWGHIRASDIGAPHQRERWFLVAYTTGVRCERDQQRPQQDRFQQGWTPELAGGNQTELVNPAQRPQHIDESHEGKQQQTVLTTASKRDAGKPVRRSTMVNPGSAGREKCNAAAFADRTRHTTRRLNAARGNGQPESRLGGFNDGLPGGMDFPGFPARPGENQYSYEPPRVTVGKVQDRAARLKSLGNAVVPYQVYPILASIHEWLEGLTLEQVA